MTQPHQLRVAVIGIGFGQQVLVPAFRSDPRCEVVGICATTHQRANEVATRLGLARAFGSWQEMVDDASIDALAIATPPGLQAEIALHAIERGKHVFCEKPVAATLGQAGRLAEAARAAGVAHMVDFWYPDLPAWQAARRLITEGSLGNVRHVLASWQVETWATRHGAQSWKVLDHEGGGVLNMFGSHAMYNLEWLVGPIERLSAAAYQDSRPGWTADTDLHLSLALVGNVPVSMALSTRSVFGSGYRIEVYGDEGALTLVNSSADYARGFTLFHGTRTSGSLQAHGSKTLTEDGDGRVPAVATLVRRFVDWCAGGAPATPDFEAALRNQQLLDAARRSSATESWIPADACFNSASA